MQILRPDFYLLYWQARAPVRRRPPGLMWEPGSPRHWGHNVNMGGILKSTFFSEASKLSCHFQNALGFQKFKPHWFTVRLKLLNVFIVCADETWLPTTHTSVRFSFTATISLLSLTLRFHVEGPLSLVFLNMPMVHQWSEDGDLAVSSGQRIAQCPVDVDLQES